MLDEVVVVGYGVQKKKLVTGATVQVKGDENSQDEYNQSLAGYAGTDTGCKYCFDFRSTGC